MLAREALPCRCRIKQLHAAQQCRGNAPSHIWQIRQACTLAYIRHAAPCARIPLDHLAVGVAG